jgi:hypothetical protein
VFVELDHDVPVVRVHDGPEAVLGLGDSIAFGMRSHDAQSYQ